jgi:hypothetical protein
MEGQLARASIASSGVNSLTVHQFDARCMFAPGAWHAGMKFRLHWAMDMIGRGCLDLALLECGEEIFSSGIGIKRWIIRWHQDAAFAVDQDIVLVPRSRLERDRVDLVFFLDVAGERVLRFEMVAVEVHNMHVMRYLYNLMNFYLILFESSAHHSRRRTS